MPEGTTSRISGPETLDFEGPVHSLEVRLVSGTVNVVGTDAPGARVEVDAVHGPPLTVTYRDGALGVGYDDVPWKKFLARLDRSGRRREAVVSVSVPAHVRLHVGVVDATAVVSGIDGPTDVRGVSGGATLVGLSGAVRADTVSGAVEAQSLTGGLRFHSVSGDLTVIDSAGPGTRAETVSGSVVLDLAEPAGARQPGGIGINTVSGEVAIRLPDTTSATVRARTAGGAVSSAFPELTADTRWGAGALDGTLGEGGPRIDVNTVSGTVALLRRPPTDDHVPAAPTSLSKDV